MAEATHTAEPPGYGLRQPVGRGGGRLMGGYAQIDDAETLDTGMDWIDSCWFTEVEDRGTDTPLANPTSVATTGVLTVSVGALDDNTADTGSNHYWGAIGRMN